MKFVFISISQAAFNSDNSCEFDLLNMLYWI